MSNYARMFTPVALTLLAILFLPATTAQRAYNPEARLRPIEETWTITNKFVNPDGIPKLVPVVNGQFPGPELRGRAGQRVVITVRNHLPMETTSIHWHGLKQKGTPWHDGVPGVTQCGIPPGGQHVYNFTLDKPGTLWWHSHSGMQKTSLHGALLVEGDEGEPSLGGCKTERTLILSDWYHATEAEQMAGLLDAPFRWIGDAQSMLVNGVGAYDCSAVFASEEDERACQRKAAFYNATENAPGLFRLDVEYNTCYRLRIVGASSLFLINFGIEQHTLKIVETETTLLESFDTDFLDVGSGQSYSALLRTKEKADVDRLTNNTGKFWIQLNVRHRASGPVGRAILTYPSASKDRKLPVRPAPKSPDRDDVEWSLREARRQKALRSVQLPKATRRVMMLGSQNKLAGDRIVWAMNNISYVEQPTPVLHALKHAVMEETSQYISSEWPPVEFNYSRTLAEEGLRLSAELGMHVIKVRKDEVVDFVFQNSVALSGAKYYHPWHLHVHNFWVLKYGDFNTVERHEDRVSYVSKSDAVSRNTFGLYPNSWVTIRVQFDRPGAANFRTLPLAHSSTVLPNPVL